MPTDHADIMRAFGRMRAGCRISTPEARLDHLTVAPSGDQIAPVVDLVCTGAADRNGGPKGPTRNSANLAARAVAGR